MENDLSHVDGVVRHRPSGDSNGRWGPCLRRRCHRTALVFRRRDRRRRLAEGLHRGITTRACRCGESPVRHWSTGTALITVVGGKPDALIVAFDKHTGEEVWRALPTAVEMGYGQPVIYEAGGVRQLIVWHPSALASLDPVTGEIYWEQPWDTTMGLTVATPVRSGDYLLVSQFFNGSMMMRLSRDRPAATMLWQGDSRSELPDDTAGLHALVTTPVIRGDHIYGVGSYGELRGLDARTGERLWVSPDMNRQVRWGAAFIVQHGDRYLVNNDGGFLITARLTPEGYVELDRTRLIEPTSGSGTQTPHGRIAERRVNWSHPAYANRHIVHRNDREIVRLSLDASDYR